MRSKISCVNPQIVAYSGIMVISSRWFKSEKMDTWVNFKLFGLMGLTIAFIILQALYLSRHITEDDLDNTTENNRENQ